MLRHGQPSRGSCSAGSLLHAQATGANADGRASAHLHFFSDEEQIGGGRLVTSAPAARPGLCKQSTSRHVAARGTWASVPLVNVPDSTISWGRGPGFRLYVVCVLGAHQG